MDKLFSGIFPTGISYADRSKTSGGDYHRVAFLSFETLELKIYDERSPLLPEIKEHAANLQARKGEPFNTSACGQPVTLGYGCLSPDKS